MSSSEGKLILRLVLLCALLLAPYPIAAYWPQIRTVFSPTIDPDNNSAADLFETRGTTWSNFFSEVEDSNPIEFPVDSLVNELYGLLSGRSLIDSSSCDFVIENRISLAWALVVNGNEDRAKKEYERAIRECDECRGTLGARTGELIEKAQKGLFDLYLRNVDLASASNLLASISEPPPWIIGRWAKLNLYLGRYDTAVDCFAVTVKGELRKGI